MEIQLQILLLKKKKKKTFLDSSASIPVIYLSSTGGVSHIFILKTQLYALGKEEVSRKNVHMHHVFSAEIKEPSDSLQNMFKNLTRFNCKGGGQEGEKNYLTKSFPQDGRS